MINRKGTGFLNLSKFLEVNNPAKLQDSIINDPDKGLKKLSDSTTNLLNKEMENFKNNQEQLKYKFDENANIVKTNISNILENKDFNKENAIGVGSNFFREGVIKESEFKNPEEIKNRVENIKSLSQNIDDSLKRIVSKDGIYNPGQRTLDKLIYTSSGIQNEEFNPELQYIKTNEALNNAISQARQINTLNRVDSVNTFNNLKNLINTGVSNIKQDLLNKTDSFNKELDKNTNLIQNFLSLKGSNFNEIRNNLLNQIETLKNNNLISEEDANKIQFNLSSMGVRNADYDTPLIRDYREEDLKELLNSDFLSENEKNKIRIILNTSNNNQFRDESEALNFIKDILKNTNVNLGQRAKIGDFADDNIRARLDALSKMTNDNFVSDLGKREELKTAKVLAGDYNPLLQQKYNKEMELMDKFIKNLRDTIDFNKQEREKQKKQAIDDYVKNATTDNVKDVVNKIFNNENLNEFDQALVSSKGLKVIPSSLNTEESSEIQKQKQFEDEYSKIKDKTGHLSAYYNKAYNLIAPLKENERYNFYRFLQDNKNNLDNNSQNLLNKLAKEWGNVERGLTHLFNKYKNRQQMSLDEMYTLQKHMTYNNFAQDYFNSADQNEINRVVKLYVDGKPMDTKERFLAEKAMGISMF